MKKCPKCNLENTVLMNFCVECGTPLGNAFSGQQTASYPTEVVTSSESSHEAQTVVSNFQPPPEIQTVVNSFQPPPETKTIVTNAPSYTPPPTPHFSVAPNYSPSTPPSNSSKTFLIIGGIVALLVLGGIGVVGIGIVALYSQNGGGNPPPPTVTPTTPIQPVTPPKTRNKPAGTEPSADYEEMRVDFNVTEGGQKGLRMNVSFTANNMKGVDSYLAIYLQKSDGTAVNGKVPAFRAKTGQVAVFKLLRPAYDVTQYQDQQLFIPYTAFGLPAGKYDLQMNVNLIYKTDGLIQHLHVYDFEFEQK